MVKANSNQTRVLKEKTTKSRKKPISDEFIDDSYVYTIGDLSKEFGVTLRTLRFYEDRGLIKPKRSGLTRLYNEASKERLREIVKATSLGFTLTEIRSLLGADGSAKAAPILKLSKAQIEEQLEHLTRQKEEIEKAIEELLTMQKLAA